MDFAAVYFWVGMVVLILSAIVLSYLESDRMAARIAARNVILEDAEAAMRALASADRVSLPAVPPLVVPKNMRLSRTVQRGAVEIAIWKGAARSKGATTYAVTVNQNRCECSDCISCMNDAVSWIREQEVAAVQDSRGPGWR